MNTALPSQVLNCLFATTPPVTETAPAWFWSFFDFTNIFWLTILVVFAAAILGVIFQYRSRDGCLKRINSFNVTFISNTSRAHWGKINVFSQGIELTWDEPHKTASGLIKSSLLVSEDELSQGRGIVRSVTGLTEHGRRLRRKQIIQSTNPGMIRRMRRRIYCFMGSIRDAFTSALNMAVGQVSRGTAMGSAISSQSSTVSGLSKSITGAAAYEPMLERHLGLPVVLSFANPEGMTPTNTELPGYLVAYTSKYLLIYAMEDEAIERWTFNVTDVAALPEQSRLELVYKQGEFTITCRDRDAILIESIQLGQTTQALNVLLLPGASATIRPTGPAPYEFTIRTTRRYDIVCPRGLGAVRFSSLEDIADHKDRHRRGIRNRTMAHIRKMSK